MAVKDGTGNPNLSREQRTGSDSVLQCIEAKVTKVILELATVVGRM